VIENQDTLVKVKTKHFFEVLTKRQKNNIVEHFLIWTFRETLCTFLCPFCRD